MSSDLLLVGSVPLETAEEVFRACAQRFGAYLDCFPDGEVGERHRWVTYQAYRVMHGHPEIDTLKRPAPEDGVEVWRPRDFDDYWAFRVKPGVGRVRFGDLGWRLGYAREALNSYFVFKTLREQGVIPARARFQVSLPLPLSVIYLQFRDLADWEKIGPGYEEAMRAEVATIVRKIPSRDLVLQWDCATEIVDLEDRLSWTPKEGRLERIRDEIARLDLRTIPDDVWLGLHICYGTLGGWPAVQPRDFSLCVKVADLAAQAAGRRLDYVHMPTLADRFDDTFYAPLRDLRVGDARIYLGMILDWETNTEPLERRITVASRYLADFGLAAPCGFGRRPPAEIPRALDAHRTAAETLRMRRAFPLKDK